MASAAILSGRKLKSTPNVQFEKVLYVCAVIQVLTTSDDVRHANGRLVIFSVHSQTSAINFGSRQRGLDLAGLDLTKYSPETCATSGEVARYGTPQRPVLNSA